ncbi:MAG: hypothetical protein COT38_01705 [Candidatus Omnitrophica bacterium CG08_land_8_20_14_0_20_41_16]|uniref:DUF3568 family protein n=1 Tax=Candidatus Sherwoodlollariibacterium unditelluris TaxID=1974757 RepID=A0A2G9YHP6_9BACT|nr:MAG: hypothetical protein COX41_06645 [Candidatus Omnitrophica bacterium CG23_combo_of_CG06-09_8_20_14_all_41_10]PIS34151.1 MAG: hypothetical protein COT38_01705 [Candidatus Omnitrophica bacterium CG08_land_8_20_14_0_20_41_16]
MVKKFLVFISSILILANIYGCFAVLAGGVAGGTGTCVWLSGKLIQQVNASLEQTTKAAKLALQSLKLSILTKETASQGIVQIRSHDIDGEKIWIDIHRITDTSSQIQVRVGTVISNKEAADRILKRILQNL